MSTVSASALRNSADTIASLLEDEKNTLSELNKSVQSITLQYQGLNSWENKELVDERVTTTYVTVTTWKTYVHISGGGLSPYLNRFNTAVADFESAMAEMIRYTEAINESADSIAANNEAIIDALLGVDNSDTPGTNTPSTNTPSTNTPSTNTPSTNTPSTNTPSGISSGGNSSGIGSSSDNSSSGNSLIESEDLSSNDISSSSESSSQNSAVEDSAIEPAVEDSAVEDPAIESVVEDSTVEDSVIGTTIEESVESPTPNPTSEYVPIPDTGIQDDNSLSKMAIPIAGAVVGAGIGLIAKNTDKEEDEEDKNLS